MAALSPKQQVALGKFPVGEWVQGPDVALCVPISTLRSLVNRGLLEHKPAEGIPVTIVNGGLWTQNLKMGIFLRKI